ncbi:hypothetical protein [Hydrogenimonas urashimensis]|uniref:hypothetical protein n=1 Tax=Hydrogenimonas urashimensis TaxID=2740515 RepID=UPI00191591C9|nr:hypothetical protein [Hydrogenimonas urashimensis]
MKRRYLQLIPTILSVLFLTASEMFGAKVPSDTDKLKERIAKRLPQLSYHKMEALMARIGKKTPNGFYDCLCKQSRGDASMGVNVFYHPQKLEGSPACKNTAAGPCVASGLGCWRFQLPSDSNMWRYCIENNKYDDGKSIIDLIADSVVGLRQEQRWKKAKKNRPHWMKYPSSVDNYAVKLSHYFTRLQLKGFPTKKLRKLNAMIRAHIMRLKTPGKLPTFWHSLGLPSPGELLNGKVPPGENREQLEAWRKGLLEKYDRYFLKLMKSENPLTIAEGMRKYTKAMQRYDEAAHLMADGILDEISANQDFVTNIVESVPGVGDVLDGFALVGYLGEKIGLTESRNWTLNGKQVTALDAFLRFAGQAAPKAFESLLKRSALARDIVKGIGEMSGNFGRRSKEVMNKILDGFGTTSRKGYDRIGKYLIHQRKRIMKSFEEKIKVAKKIFKRTPEYAEAAARRAKDVGDARKLLKRLQKTAKGSSEYEKLVIELQKNKTAQWLVNTDEFSDAFRKDINDHIAKWYKKADAGTAHDIKRILMANEKDVERIAKEMNIDPEVAKKFREKAKNLAKKHGKNLEEIEIDTLKITNRRPNKKGIGVGRDRDLTDQLVFKVKGEEGKVTRLTMDVDHKLSEHIYERNFYKNLHNGKLPDDPKKIHDWVHNHMDQTVTSKWHPEAYNVGEVSLDDFLDKGITPTIARPADVADTIVFKSTVWFDRAGKSADPVMKARNVAEGMRQATKQWKDLIMSRAKQYGLPPNAIPEQLEKAMNIFKKVATGKMMPEEGEYILKEVLHTDKESVVRQMGAFFEGMEKTSGRVYRAGKAEYYEKMIRSIAGSGKDEAERIQGMKALYNALQQGYISASKFRALQGEILSEKMRSFHTAFEARKWARVAKKAGVISGGQYSVIMRKAKELENGESDDKASK